MAETVSYVLDGRVVAVEGVEEFAAAGGPPRSPGQRVTLEGVTYVIMSVRFAADRIEATILPVERG